MAITAANIKWYQCTVWTEGSTHGGDIDTGNEITSATDQNVFDDVTDAERVSGDTEYRKIYIRNENVDTWNTVKGWLSATPDNTTITIKLGTNAGVQSVEGVAAGYVAPDSKVHADVLAVGSLAEDAYQSIWIKRVVAASADGETADSFTVKCESS